MIYFYIQDCRTMDWGNGSAKTLSAAKRAARKQARDAGAEWCRVRYDMPGKTIREETTDGGKTWQEFTPTWR